MSTQNTKKLKVGTRDSILARLQTDLALSAISKKFPELEFEIIAVKAMGDKILNKPLAELGGRGVFVKELEDALLNKSVDFVVHSLKDLPTDSIPGLVLAASFDRADVRDVLVSKNNVRFADLPANSKVATSSRRRAAQLAAIRKDISFVDIRGNIQTRLRKLDEGQCDAMVLAAAGLLRLGLADRIAEFFETKTSTPAVGQGALAIECRSDDADTISILNAVNEPDVWACISAERAFLNKLGGGCSVPVGAIAVINAEREIEITACVASLDGNEILKDTMTGAYANAEDLGRELADKLISQGALNIVEPLLKASAGIVSAP